MTIVRKRSVVGVSRAVAGRILFVLACLSAAASCGSTQPPPRAPATPPFGAAAAAQSCPTPAVAPRQFEVPDFALSPGAFASFLGDDIIVMRVGSPDHRQATQRHGEPPEYRGAIYELATNRWRDIPPPPPAALPTSASTERFYRVLDRRLVMVVYSTMKLPTSAGFVFDATTNQWTELPPQGAPPTEVFLTGPMVEATVGSRWILWPLTNRGARYDAGIMIDAAQARWMRAAAQGAPRGSGSRPHVLPNGHVLVVPRDSTTGGTFDPVANSWRSFGLPPAGSADVATVVQAPDGQSFARVSWSPRSPQRTRRLSAQIIDTQRFSATPVASSPLTLGAYPNSQYVHYDGQQIIYIDQKELHRYERATGVWSTEPLPFAAPVRSGGSLRPVCGRRLLLSHHEYSLLDLQTRQWRTVPWPADAPQVGRHMLYGLDRIALLGRVYDDVQPYNCPPGAPCAAPRVQEIRDKRAYIIPLQ